MPALGVIVGEAPGREEEKAGRPFVGPSGRLLDTALAALGVPRGSVYVTNVVKFWPRDLDGKTRRPLEEEIEEWMPLLEEEILNAAPVCVLALGATAFRALTGSDERAPWGVYGDYDGLHLVPAWHPSYVLRSGKYGEQAQWLEQLRTWARKL